MTLNVYECGINRRILTVRIQKTVLMNIWAQTQHLRLNEYAKYLKISFFSYVTSHVTLDVYKCGINRRVLTVRIQINSFKEHFKAKKLRNTLKTIKKP